MKNTNKPMLFDLIIGIGLYCIVGIVFILALPIPKLYNMIGFVVGVIMAILMIVHMASGIETTLSLNEEDALKHSKKSYLFRIVIFLAVFIIMGLFFRESLVAALFGIMSLKISAYIQPLIHKVSNKIYSKGR